MKLMQEVWKLTARDSEGKEVARFSSEAEARQYAADSAWDIISVKREAYVPVSGIFLTQKELDLIIKCIGYYTDKGDAYDFARWDVLNQVERKLAAAEKEGL